MAIYTGTTGVDTFNGANAVADIFRFTPTTLSPSDTVNGGTGNVVDALQLTAPGTYTAAMMSGISHIEEIDLANGTNDITIPIALANSSDQVLTLSGSLYRYTNYPHALTIRTGAGDNHVVATGATAALSFYAGSGNDTFVGNGASFFHFNVGDLNAGDHLSGPSTTNYLYLSGAGAVTADDTTGVSSLIGIILENPGIDLTLDSGFFVRNYRTGFVIQGSSGADFIDLRGTSDTNYFGEAVGISLSGGDDTVLSTADTTVAIRFDTVGDLTAGDTIQVERSRLTFGTAGTITAAALAHVTGITRIDLAQGTNNLTLTNAMGGTAYNNSIAVNANGSTTLDASAMTTAGVAFTDTDASAAMRITGGRGVNSFTVAAVTADDVLRGSGADKLTVTGSTALDATTLAGVSGVSSITVAGNLQLDDAFFARNADVIAVTASTYSGQRIDASTVADADHRINVTFSQSATLFGGAGADTFTVTGGYIGSSTIIDGGSGSAIDTLRVVSSNYGGQTISTANLANISGVERLETSHIYGIAIDDHFVDTAYGHAVTVTADVATGIDASGVTKAANSVTLIGSDFDDGLTGGAGADTLEGGLGNDRLNGGAGSDTASYEHGGAGVNVDLTITGPQNTGGAGSDTLVSIENITGSAYGDTLTGDAGANTLRGLAGNDVLHGGAGNDSLSGGAGNDLIDGGDGIDAASYGLDGAVKVDLAVTGAQDTGGAGIDTLVSIENLYGSNYNDTLYGNAGANTLIGFGGDDVLQGRDGNDYLQGRDGNDVLVGGPGDDILDGGAGIDTASYVSASNKVYVSLYITGPQDTGVSGRDTLIGIENLIGGNYNDVLGGDGNANVIAGGAGDDIIAGRAGADTLIGGPGADRFMFYAAGDSLVATRDTINDMTAQDTVDVSGVDANTLVAGDQAFTFVSAFTKQAGQAMLIYSDATHQTNFVADTNGDGIADFAIRFLGDVTTLSDHFVL